MDIILTREEDSMLLALRLKLGLNVIIKSLYKNNYINVKLFNLFSKIAYTRDSPNFKFEISEFFHNNKILLKPILKNSIIVYYFLMELIRIEVISLSLLEYVTENIDCLLLNIIFMIVLFYVYFLIL